MKRLEKKMTPKIKDSNAQKRYMFQGNSMKISNNFSKFGVPTPSKRGALVI